MKIIIAPDSFKGSISSIKICNVLEKKIKKIMPQCEIIKIPVSDGGEGFLDAVANNKELQINYKDVMGHGCDTIPAKYGVENKTAYLELAQTTGLNLVENSHPLYATTFGFGQLILDAIDQGIRNFVLGIGGSASNDGGAGMAQALGFKFLDVKGDVITKKMNGDLIGKCYKILPSSLNSIAKCKFTIASDVSNPLLGKKGAVYTYAQQKGASETELPILEENLANLATLWEKDLGKIINHVPGAGAAGAFIDAKIKNGGKYILDILEFDSQIKDADMIITGEGKIDFQTCHGKILSAIIRMAKDYKIPVNAICGILESYDGINQDYNNIIQLTDFDTSENTIKNPEKYLEIAVKQIF